MQRHMFLMTLGIGTIALTLGAARADPSRCAPRDSIVAKLSETYTETRRFIGLDAASNMVEIFGAAGGNWTILVTRPDGIACVAAVGQYFEMEAVRPPTRGKAT